MSSQSPVTFTSPKPITVQERIPGEETPILISVMRDPARRYGARADSGRPYLRIVNHVDACFTDPTTGTPSNMLNLYVPKEVGLAALSGEIATLINQINDLHARFKEQKAVFDEKGVRWQDWNTKARQSMMNLAQNLMAKYNLTEAATDRGVWAYRPRGDSRTPTPTTPDAGLTKPLIDDFNADNI